MLKVKYSQRDRILKIDIKYSDYYIKLLLY